MPEKWTLKEYPSKFKMYDKQFPFLEKV